MLTTSIVGPGASDAPDTGLTRGQTVTGPGLVGLSAWRPSNNDND